MTLSGGKTPELDALKKVRLAGRLGGRKLFSHQEQDIRESIQAGRRTAKQCGRLFGAHPSTVARLLQRGLAAVTQPVAEAHPGTTQSFGL
ncbi:hypothetical protein [Deinococcus humi]|uniref:Uncharacterized protein n=1 Tax=Deinococcus humi TaxID=662880 RepID=A0A7W8JXU7_9DEIO|nr:hypothetical protein [Deinococcus humi]MBB5365226.1 hypothetical protein [Deinococcus humi]GGO35674.1 hypothetical protein GCM10008949_38520 [Deinococcus humi]